MRGLFTEEINQELGALKIVAGTVNTTPVILMLLTLLYMVWMGCIFPAILMQEVKGTYTNHR